MNYATNIKKFDLIDGYICTKSTGIKSISSLMMVTWKDSLQITESCERKKIIAKEMTRHRIQFATYEEIEPLLTVIRTSIETQRPSFEVYGKVHSVGLVDNDAIRDQDKIFIKVVRLKPICLNTKRMIYHCHLIPWPNEESCINIPEQTVYCPSRRILFLVGSQSTSGGNWRP